MQARRGLYSESGPGTLKAQAPAAVFSNGLDHSVAKESAWPAAQAYSGRVLSQFEAGPTHSREKARNTVSNPIRNHWWRWREVRVDERDELLFQEVEVDGGNGPTEAGAFQAPFGLCGYCSEGNIAVAMKIYEGFHAGTVEQFSTHLDLA
jgi:hypothetical protein